MAEVALTDTLLLIIIAMLAGWMLWIHQHHVELLRYFDALAEMLGEVLDERGK